EVQKIVGDYLKEKDEQKKKADEQKKKADEQKKKADEQKKEAEGYRIGSDLTMKASWKDGFVASTANDDFSLHVGGWIQYDNVFWDQSNLLRLSPGARPAAKQGVFTGVSAGGIGDLQDGMFFRRERLQLDGKFWENYEYNLIFAFENDQFNIIGLDEFWVGAMNIPVIGTARIGHVKNAIGLEADMTAS